MAKTKRQPLYPIKPELFTNEQAAQIGRSILIALRGVKEHDEINGAGMVEVVMLALQIARDNPGPTAETIVEVR